MEIQEGEHSILKAARSRGRIRSKHSSKLIEPLIPKDCKEASSGGAEIGHLLRVWYMCLVVGGMSILDRVVVTQNLVKGNGKGSHVDVIKCAW